MNKKQRLVSQIDNLFKQKCFEVYGRECELCGETFLATAHHFYYRLSCSHLRWDIENGVILCGRCHARLHFKDPKLVENPIIEKRGRKWYNKLKKKAENPGKYYKFNIQWIEEQLTKLKGL